MCPVSQVVSPQESCNLQDPRKKNVFALKRAILGLHFLLKRNMEPTAFVSLMYFSAQENVKASCGSYVSPADEWLEVGDPCCGFDEAICTVRQENNGSSFYCNVSPGTHQHGCFIVQWGVLPDDKSEDSVVQGRGSSTARSLMAHVLFMAPFGCCVLL